MREMRFRAWDARERRWVSAGEYTLCSDGKSMEDGCGYVYDVESRFVIEQFIGLKDSQGKDIYEGDIVKWSHGPGVSDVGVVEYRTRDEFGSHPMAAFYGLSVSRFAGLCQFQSDDRYEVIGNIHETPELLKK